MLRFGATYIRDLTVDLGLTIDKTYLTFLGKLWGVCCEHLEEKWSHYKGIALYILTKHIHSMWIYLGCTVHIIIPAKTSIMQRWRGWCYLLIILKQSANTLDNRFYRDTVPIVLNLLESHHFFILSFFLFVENICGLSHKGVTVLLPGFAIIW